MFLMCKFRKKSHIAVDLLLYGKIFNAAASNIRNNGTFMGVQKVKYGVKGSGQSTELVDANVYNHVIEGKIYYYWETTGGQFISAGLKTQ